MAAVSTGLPVKDPIHLVAGIGHVAILAAALSQHAQVKDRSWRLPFCRRCRRRGSVLAQAHKLLQQRVLGHDLLQHLQDSLAFSTVSEVQPVLKEATPLVVQLARVQHVQLKGRTDWLACPGLHWAHAGVGGALHDVGWRTAALELHSFAVEDRKAKSAVESARVLPEKYSLWRVEEEQSQQRIWWPRQSLQPPELPVAAKSAARLFARLVVLALEVPGTAAEQAGHQFDYRQRWHAGCVEGLLTATWYAGGVRHTPSCRSGTTAASVARLMATAAESAGGGGGGGK